MNPVRANDSAGFTIIELLIVVAIVGVLATLGAPNLRDLVVSQRVKTAASDLHLSLILARSEAIKRNATVQVVPVNTANWSLGWSVAAGSDVLSRQDAYSNVTFTGPAANVAYVGTGRISGTAVSFFIRATSVATITARCVQIEASGRPGIRLDKDGNYTDGVCGI